MTGLFFSNSTGKGCTVLEDMAFSLDSAFKVDKTANLFFVAVVEAKANNDSADARGSLPEGFALMRLVTELERNSTLSL